MAMLLRRLLPGLLAAALGGCATVPGDSPSAAAGAADGAQARVAAAEQAPALGAGAVVEAFGVQLKGVRLSANGYIVDLRYRVLDPAKAQPLLDRKVRPVLVDEVTGDRFYVPVPPIIGALRQTSRNKVIHTDRDYFMLFANPDRKLQAGSKVALYVGDQRFGNLQVEAQPAPTAQSVAQPVAR
ncbi:MAG: hypothetical protein ACOY5V_00315 [Pseudomonadota bacterium]